MFKAGLMIMTLALNVKVVCVQICPTASRVTQVRLNFGGVLLVN